MAWYNANWIYREPIQSQNAQIDEALSKAYIDLSEFSATFWANVKNGGGDIRITQADGTTEVAREVVFCDTGTDKGEVHFDCTGMQTGSDITWYIYYGNAAASDYAVGATYGAENVWAAAYKGVWHLQDDFLDSTDNDNDGTGHGIVFAAAKLGDGIDPVEAESDYVGCGNDGSLHPNNVTVICWAKVVDIGDGEQHRPFCMPYDTEVGWDSPYTAYSILFSRTGANIQTIGSINVGGVYKQAYSDLGDESINTMYHLVMTHDGSNVRVYVNAVEVTNSPTAAAGNLGYNGLPSFVIAQRSEQAAGQFFDGIIDEVQILNAAKSANWITTEFNNQDDPATFWSIGAPESLYRHFVGDTDDDWNDASNWAHITGGTGGAGVPTAVNDVVFDGNSPDCTLDTTGQCLSFDMQAGYAGQTFDQNGSELYVRDGITVSGGTVISGTSARLGLTGSGPCVVDVGSAFFYQLWIENNGTTTITGTCKCQYLNLDQVVTINGGTIEVTEQIEAHGSPISGTCGILLSGGSNQAIVMNDQDGLPNGDFEIDKSAGTATVYVNELDLGAAGQDLTVTSGTLDLGGENLTVNGTFTVTDTLRLRGTETITTGTTTIGGASTVVYYGAGTAEITDLAQTFFNITLGASKTHEVATGGGNGITVNGALASDGTAGTRSILRSVADAAVDWELDLQGTSSLTDEVDVKRSDASAGNEVSALGSVDSGNNTNWLFFLVVIADRSMPLYTMALGLRADRSMPISIEAVLEVPRSMPLSLLKEIYQDTNPIVTILEGIVGDRSMPIYIRGGVAVARSMPIYWTLIVNAQREMPIYWTLIVNAQREMPTYFYVGLHPDRSMRISIEAYLQQDRSMFLNIMTQIIADRSEPVRIYEGLYADRTPPVNYSQDRADDRSMRMDVLKNFYQDESVSLPIMSKIIQDQSAPIYWTAGGIVSVVTLAMPIYWRQGIVTDVGPPVQTLEAIRASEAPPLDTLTGIASQGAMPLPIIGVTQATESMRIDILKAIAETVSVPVDLMKLLNVDRSMEVRWLGEAESIVTLSVPIYWRQGLKVDRSTPVSVLKEIEAALRSMEVRTLGQVVGVAAVPLSWIATRNIDKSMPLTISKVIEQSQAMPVRWIQLGLVTANRMMPVYILSGEPVPPTEDPSGEALLINRTDEYSLVFMSQADLDALTDSQFDRK